MILRKLFERKKKKEATEPREKNLKEKDNVPHTTKEAESPKDINDNVVRPFYHEKTTSFPPPLSLDAAVLTDPKREKQVSISNEKMAEDAGKGEIKDDVKDVTENDKKIHPLLKETCDGQTCANEKCGPQTCENSWRGSVQDDTEHKISPTKLTAIINTSIKEAMETIVKQCRMDERKDVDKEPKEKHGKSLVGRKTDSIKVKRECQSRAIQELNNRLKASKSVRLQKKCKNFRTHYKKLHDRNAKVRTKRGTVCEQGKKNKHSRSANSAKTDNRRMTGNVNIYICSEATENAQAITKQKSADPYTGSSSETTTEESQISTNKLVTGIQNKRRKTKEQNSSDCLPKTEEDSDNSTICTSQYTDSGSTAKLDSNSLIEVCHSPNTDVCVNDTSSTLTDCKCKSVNDDDAIQRSKFVICNKIEKPCSTIYTTKSLSNSESEGWSSKSGSSSRNTDTTLCDNWSLEPSLSNYISNEDTCKVFKRNLGSSHKCQRRDRELIEKYNARCNCKSKKYSSKIIEKGNSMQPWSTCNCITEEEEEDVCVDVKSEESAKSCEEQKGKVTVCRKTCDSREPTKFVPCTKYPTDLKKSSEDLEEEIPENARTSQMSQQHEISEGGADKEETFESHIELRSEERKAEQISATQKAARQPMSIPPKRGKFIGGRIIRPEVILLKNILKQQKPPAQVTDQNSIVASTPVKIGGTEPIQNEGYSKIDGTQVSPHILKKFNLRNQHRYQRQSVVEEKEMVPRKKEVEETLDNKENEKDKDKETKGFQEWFRETFLFKCLSKILHRSEDSETKPEELIEKDKITEPTSADTSTDKNVEIPRTEIDENQLVEKAKIEITKTDNEKDKLVSSKVNPHNATENKGDISEPRIISFKNQQDKESENTDTKSIPAADSSGRVKMYERKPIIDTEFAKEVKSVKPPTVTESPETTKKFEDFVSPNGLQFRKKSDAQERRESEFQKARTQDQNQDRKVHLDVDSDRESITVCAQVSSEPHESDLHTICIDSTYAKYPSTNEYLSNEETTCKCCCVPVSQCSNKPANYPKGCLKKEKQCCHTEPQANNCSISYQKECACRRLCVCNTCCRPRNECSCRLTIPGASCYNPKNKCKCKSVYETRNTSGYIKSMFCLYCDNPRDKCTCRAPMRKCSCCELSVDLCMCKDQKTICDGRPVLTEPDNDRIMYVTAWKPREEVRRYFSRNFTDLQTDSINECCCCEKLKPHNSDDLPYQRLSVFSDVMDELQHKISESACCTRCGKVPCCCGIKAEREEGRDERKIKYCISPKTRRKIIAVCMDKSTNKLSNICKCDSGQAKSDKQNKIIIPVYCVCKATPCKCRKSKSIQKKPKAKCYYCKSSPCICIKSRERNKPRPCRCTDSPCRTKEKESVPCGKTSTKPKNNDEKSICVR